MTFRVHNLTLIVIVPALLNLTVTPLPQSAETEQDPLLADGNPPLRQSDMDAWQRLVEFAFEATLTPDQRTLLQTELLKDWQEADNLTRTRLLQAQSVWAQVGTALGTQKELLRLSLRAQLLDAAERDPESPVNSLILTLYEASSPLLVEGDPPLRKGALDALFSLLEWLAIEVTGHPAELTEMDRHEFAAQIARHYPHAAPGDRMLLSHMEETLAWLRSEWEKTDPQEQNRLRDHLARLFGLPRPFLPAPFTGVTETWQHPDGMFEVDYPADWPARYATLPQGTLVAGWELFDLSVLGEASTEVLELKALPSAGALIAVVALPAEVLNDRMTLEEGVFVFAEELLGRFGMSEPLGNSTSGRGAVLTLWRQMTNGDEYSIFFSTILLPELRGAAIITLARAPSAAAPDIGPAFSRIIYSLKPHDSAAPPLIDLLDMSQASAVARTLLHSPLRQQMDLIEGLTSEIR
ncbi:MAG: hypothetical protein ACUVX8_10245 [Candidatus Zipacnadales bacterium]